MRRLTKSIGTCCDSDPPTHLPYALLPLTLEHHRSGELGEHLPPDHRAHLGNPHPRHCLLNVGEDFLMIAVMVAHGHTLKKVSSTRNCPASFNTQQGLIASTYTRARSDASCPAYACNPPDYGGRLPHCQQKPKAGCNQLREIEGE